MAKKAPRDQTILLLIGLRPLEVEYLARHVPHTARRGDTFTSTVTQLLPILGLIGPGQWAVSWSPNVLRMTRADR